MPTTSNQPSWALAGIVFVVGTLLAAMTLQNWFNDESLARFFLSNQVWHESIRGLKPAPNTPDGEAGLSYFSVLWLIGPLALGAWGVGAMIIAARTRQPIAVALTCWAAAGWGWWCALEAWELIWLLATLTRPATNNFLALWNEMPPYWLAGCLAGWLATGLTLASARSTEPAGQLSSPDHGSANDLSRRWAVCGLVLAISLFIAVSITLNWRLYFNLLIPHGDSAMYEEHLWNVLHGKGFRSYLDQGLFWGEHIQCVHLLLIPVYLLYPSHLTMEACSSIALGLGAWPVYRLTHRHTGRRDAALLVATAYLLYFPMQFLDIEIDLKTFRPESFGIPLLLFTLDQIDRRALGPSLLGIVLCLTVKEDYTLILGPLGLWLMADSFAEWRRPVTEPSRSHPFRRLLGGAALTLGAGAYLFVAIRILMPWFRDGHELHYVSYFQQFGNSPEAILRSWITNPQKLFSELAKGTTALFAYSLLVPVGFVALFSPGRLAVGLPLFLILSLNELAPNVQHHFHAPLVAIIFWATAAGLPRCIDCLTAMRQWFSAATAARFAPRWVLASALACELFFSTGPLNPKFWMPGAYEYWYPRYGPSERGPRFAAVFSQIPTSAKVASTDHVHTRFTHHERSYDYSEYPRKVSDYLPKVPDDTDYIVIDTNHRYSEIHQPREIREYRDHPEQWELLPDTSSGWFLVLKRKR